MLPSIKSQVNKQKCLHKSPMPSLFRKYLLMPKLLYFNMSLFFYSLHVYRSQFATYSYNVDAGEWGMYLAIPQCASFIFGIKAATANDMYGRQKLVLGGAIVLATCILCSFFMVNNFFIFLTLFTLYFSLVSITLPLIDKIVLDYLQNTENTDVNSYGRQRQFVSLGYIVVTFIMDTFIVKSTGSGPTKTFDFSLVPLYAVVAGGIALISVLLWVKNLPKRSSMPNAASSFIILLKNKEYLFLLIIILLNGITRASMTNYLSQYFTDHLEFKSDQPTSPAMGFFEKLHNGRKITCLVISSNIPEFIVFILSDKIVTKFGLLWPILISQIFQLIRFFGYIVLSPQHPYRFEYALLLELCKGFNFGLIQCSIATLALKLCPPYLKSTAQLVYNGVFVAIGSVIGGLSFKLIFSTYAGGKSKSPAAYKTVFLWDFVLTAVCIALMIIKYCIKENLLFSKQNLDRKLEQIERQNLLEENEILGNGDKICTKDLSRTTSIKS